MGTSFLKALEGGLGAERVFRDYGNRISRLNVDAMISSFDDFNRQIRISAYHGIECIHGRFTTQKYTRLLECGWIAIAWMREPSSHLLSRFRHIRRTAHQFKYEPGTIGYVTLREDLDFKAFALHPMTRNYMQRFFTDAIPYAFVGITEKYREDLDYFLRKFIGRNLSYSVENNAPDHLGDDPINSCLLGEIKRFHDRDYMGYQHYLSISLKREKEL